MALPTVLAALGLTEAVWLVILGIIRLLSFLYGIVFVGSVVRDVVTGGTETIQQVSQDDTIEAIIARTDLTSAQKEEMIMKYLNLQEIPWWKALTGNMGAMAMIIAGILGASYILGQRR